MDWSRIYEIAILLTIRGLDPTPFAKPDRGMVRGLWLGGGGPMYTRLTLFTIRRLRVRLCNLFLRFGYPETWVTLFPIDCTYDFLVLGYRFNKKCLTFGYECNTFVTKYRVFVRVDITFGKNDKRKDRIFGKSS